MTTSKSESSVAESQRTMRRASNYRDFVRVRRLLSALSIEKGSLDILETRKDQVDGKPIVQ